MIKLNEKSSYTFFAIAPPMSGHMIPVLRLAKALHQKGHQIYFLTSYYKMPKIKEDYPYFDTIELDDTLQEVQKERGAGYVPIQLLKNQWEEKIKIEARRIRPDAFIMDIMCCPLYDIATQLDIKCVINLPTNIEMFTLLGNPCYKNSFSFFGLTVLKPSFHGFLFENLIPGIGKMTTVVNNSLVLLNSTFGLQKPLPLGANINVVGLTLQDSEDNTEFKKDLKQWLNRIQTQRLGIVYVTFGSLVTLTKRFIDHFYYGLKSLGMGVIWSLKQGGIPEQNENFFVRAWLPQEQLLKRKSVRVVISHCGWGGVSQSIYALKPILAVPLFGDQPTNAKIIVEKKIGLLLRQSDAGYSPHVIIDNPRFTHEQLRQKIHKIISDNEIVDRIAKVKLLSQKDGGLPRCCTLIEEAMEVGYSHLVSKDIEVAIKRNFYNTLKWLVMGAAAAGLASVGYYYFKDKIHAELK